MLLGLDIGTHLCAPLNDASRWSTGWRKGGEFHLWRFHVRCRRVLIFPLPRSISRAAARPSASFELREYSVQHCPASRAFFFLLRRSRHFGSVALGNRTALENLLLPPRSWRLERGASNTCATTTRYECFSTQNCNCFHLSPMERFFTRRAGPRATAWQEPHAVEDFLALLRHNAATKLEMELWPPVVKKRRVGIPTIDEQYKTGLLWLRGHARGTCRDLAAGEAARLVAPAHGAPTRTILKNITCIRIYMFTVTYTKMNILTSFYTCTHTKKGSVRMFRLHMHMNEIHYALCIRVDTDTDTSTCTNRSDYHARLQRAQIQAFTVSLRLQVSRHQRKTDTRAMLHIPPVWTGRSLLSSLLLSLTLPVNIMIAR